MAPNFIKYITRLILFPLWLLLASGYASAAVDAVAQADSPPLKMISLRIAGDAKRVRIITVFNAKPTYDLMMLGKPARLVINLPKSEFVNPAYKVEPRGFIKDVRYGMISADKARVILTSQAGFSVEKMTLNPLQNDIWQLVIDVVKISDSAFNKNLTAQRSAESKSGGGDTNQHTKVGQDQFVVVIDAGHGAFDSGAEGVSGVLEKDITLAFAKAVRGELEKKGGITVYLTREGDTFLRLNERVAKARSHGANLFISIHADFIHMPEIRGATVYTISDKASDAIAKAVAEKENKADLLDGLPPDEPPEVADILIDLTRRESDAFSTKFADNVISSFKRGKVRLITNPHRYAGFMVLRAPDVPSVLIELGYLSNREDERLIANPAWRQKMAGLIAMAIEDYATSRHLRPEAAN